MFESFEFCETKLLISSYDLTEMWTLKDCQPRFKVPLWIEVWKQNNVSIASSQNFLVRRRSTILNLDIQYWHGISTIGTGYPLLARDIHYCHGISTIGTGYPRGINLILKCRLTKILTFREFSASEKSEAEFDAAHIWLVSLKILFTVSRFKSALNFNGFETQHKFIKFGLWFSS